MSAPPYVPVPVTDKVRRYESPPWRPEPWENDRPADFAKQPTGPRLGHQGPDQGFVLRLAEHVTPEIVLAEGEHVEDVLAGCCAVALKRASLFGRAPVIHDVRIALAVWGYLAPAPVALVDRRRGAFAEAHHLHHYMQVRSIVDQVPEHVLRLSPAEVNHWAATDWTALLGPVTSASVHIPTVQTHAPLPDHAPVAPMPVTDHVPVPPAPEPVAEPEPVTEPEPVAELEREPTPEPEPELVAEPEPEPVAEAEPEPASSPVAEVEPEPVAPEPVKPSLFGAHPEPVADPRPANIDPSTTAELELVHQAREILEATAEARHADDVLPTRHHYDLGGGDAPEGDLPPEQRKPVPPRPVRTEDITSLVAEAKGALRAKQLEQAKANQEAVAAQRRALEQDNDDKS